MTAQFRDHIAGQAIIEPYGTSDPTPVYGNSRYQYAPTGYILNGSGHYSSSQCESLNPAVFGPSSHYGYFLDAVTDYAAAEYANRPPASTSYSGFATPTTTNMNRSPLHRIPSLSRNAVASSDPYPIVNRPLPTTQLHSCAMCGRLFKRKGDMERHARSHSGPRNWKCQTAGCNKEFYRKDKLVDHSKIHQTNGQ